jgi:heat shock protein HslJ
MKPNHNLKTRWNRPLAIATLILSLAALLAGCGPLAAGTATPAPATAEGDGGQGGGELAGSSPLGHRPFPRTLSFGTWAGQVWLLTSLRGEPLLEGSRITLEFETDAVGGFAGCNGYGSAGGGTGDEGTFEARDGRLRLPMMAQTAMACDDPPGVMEQEMAYMEALRQATGYRLEGDVLELQDAAGETILAFSRQEELSMDPAALPGTAWQLVTLNGQPPAEGSSITLAFHDGNRASGHAGCRDYVLGYQADEEGISFYYTAMMGWLCVTPGSQDSRDSLIRQEGAFTDALSWTDRFRLADDSGQLELLSQRGESLAFEPFAPQALPPVEGPEWVLLSFVEPNTAAGLEQPIVLPMDVITETATTLQFREGTAMGTAGCNQYSAPYNLQGTALSIEDPVRTEMFCEQPKGIMEQEERTLSWLAEAEKAQVHGRQLWLETGDGRALVFFAPDWE